MKVFVENFQALGHVEMDVTGLTVVVGPSDRGKSALIRAIEGALFNKADQHIVRKGASHTAVALVLDDKPDGTWGHNIRWEKGGGKNAFAVDGQVYDKVGRDAPDVLQTLGFKDVLIGARLKEDGKVEGGELVRPQVQHQWEGPFLLDRPGAFLNEVMVRLARLSVLQRAGKACSLDLRQAKQAVSLRREDLARAEELTTRLAPVAQMRDRMTALHVEAQRLVKETERTTILRALLARQQRLTALTRLSLPPRTPPFPEAALTRYQTLCALQLEYARWAYLVTLKLPKPTKVPKAMATAYTKWQGVAGLVVAWREVVTVERTAVVTLRLAREAEQRALDQLTKFRAQHPICPVCEKPW